MKIVPVILCGGSGTRLWPLSRDNHPKQFVNLGGGRTLFQDTLLRIKGISNVAAPIIVCNEAYRFFVSKELKKLHMCGRIILEPAPRNTAPAIALAAELLMTEADCLMLVLPADHYIQDNNVFIKAIQQAVPLAKKNKIVIFGVTPTEPETGYGYIKRGKAVENGFEVMEFIEKPNYETAKKMLAQEGYFWNAGIFLMAPGTYLKELAENEPKIVSSCKAALAASSQDNDFIRPAAQLFLNSPENSIDYALMEKTANSLMMPLDVKWSDLGSWEAFFQYSDKDRDNNVIHGEVLAKDTRNCFLYSSGRLLSTIGVSSLIVVETADASIVANLHEGQRVKEIVASLKNGGYCQYNQNPLAYESWGNSSILAKDDCFQVRRLIIDPGEGLSLRYPPHLMGHCVIASGIAEIIIADETKIYTENQAFPIPADCVCRISNPGKASLTIVEVRTGASLKEDAFSRREDKCDWSANQDD